MRLFTAIELSEDAHEHLSRLLNHWREHLSEEVVSRLGIDKPIRVSWVRDENLHVTLKFLGEVPDVEVAPLCEMLGKVDMSGPMWLRVSHIDCLPPRGPVRIIAAGLDGDVESLRQIHRAVEGVCEEFGAALDKREFRPHVTLARLRFPLPTMVRDALKDSASRYMPGSPFELRGFSLIHSILKPKGPEYAVVARFPLIV